MKQGHKFEQPRGARLSKQICSPVKSSDFLNEKLQPRPGIEQASSGVGEVQTAEETRDVGGGNVGEKTG